jgi:hypothetical protein
VTSANLRFSTSTTRSCRPVSANAVRITSPYSRSVNTALAGGPTSAGVAAIVAIEEAQRQQQQSQQSHR